MMFKKRIALDPALYERIRTAAAARGYASPEEFIHHALEKAAGDSQPPPSDEALRERLRGLGYIE
ncbi:MAG: hypothetical protein K8T26_03540 [Lentisphaerae bacterium]|nr:hypothetical protein [Lentisphaerota bacterium]